MQRGCVTIAIILTVEISWLLNAHTRINPATRKANVRTATSDNTTMAKRKKYETSPPNNIIGLKC